MRTLCTIVGVAGLMFWQGAQCFGAWPSAGSAVELKGGETLEQIQAAYANAISALVPELGYGRDSRNALAKLEATVHHAARPGAEPERLALCKAVAAALDGSAATDAKVWLLRLVAFIGRAELVPVQSRLLENSDATLRESARYALEHNPTPEAAQTLREALARAKAPQWHAALLLALGARKDAASVPAMAASLRTEHSQVIEAALDGLGRIANVEAASVLATARKGLPAGLQPAAAEASMKCAESLLKQGKAGDALAIYAQFSGPGEPRPVRLASLQGVLKASGDGAATKVLDLLAGDDSDGRDIAAGCIPELSPGALPRLAAGMNRLPPATQVMLLGTLAERGEKSALPVALNLARSNEEPLRLAALAALGRLGDLEAVPVLVDALRGGGSASGVAKESLGRLSPAGVNGALVSALQKETEVQVRVSLIEVLENRSAAVAVPALLQEAGGDNAALRRPAMRALGKLGQPGDIPALARALQRTAAGSERDDAERAMAAVCARVPERGRQAEPLLEVYRGAAPPERLILLPVLGRVGGAGALEAVKTALASSDAATYQAGVAAISNWPEADVDVEEHLLTLAQKAEKPSDRAAAARAYVRVISQASGLPELERLKRFQKAMQLAERDSEKAFILERVAELRHIETLRFVVPCLNQPALTQRAGTTIVELAKDRGLRERNRQEFERALRQVLEVSKDQALIERVKRRLAEN